MMFKADATIDGRTLEDLLGVTRKELAAKLDSKMLLTAARDESKQFSTWMAETKWQAPTGGGRGTCLRFSSGELSRSVCGSVEQVC